MNLAKIFRIQLSVYAFIILFAIQHSFFKNNFYLWMYYEKIILGVFVVSVIAVLGSVILLIYESIVSINREKQISAEIAWLLVSILAYYGVIASSLYLSTQCRL